MKNILSFIEAFKKTFEKYCFFFFPLMVIKHLFKRIYTFIGGINKTLGKYLFLLKIIEIDIYL